MPFGKKPDQIGQLFDFDLMYLSLIAPAIQEAGLESIRWDDLSGGGALSRPILEHLAACDFLIADLSANTPNVYYELGIRHALRPHTTVIIAREGAGLAMDLQTRVIRYRLNDVGRPENYRDFADRLRELLFGSVSAVCDSPVYQLLDIKPPIFSGDSRFQLLEQHFPRVSGLDWKNKISEARLDGKEELLQLESEMEGVSPEVLLELFKAYRSVGAWEELILLSGRLPVSVASSPTVQEQLAMAFNRIGQSDRAEAILVDLLRKSGPSSETYGILGRVYKDRWRIATDDRSATEALNLAIESYVKGFEADWRDYYPGVNALTLMEIRGEPDSRREEMIPVVRYAVKRKLAKPRAEYWDLATLLELEVLANAPISANRALAQIHSAEPSPWQTDTTARNLELIREARERNGSEAKWITEIERSLTK